MLEFVRAPLSDRPVPCPVPRLHGVNRVIASTMTNLTTPSASIARLTSRRAAPSSGSTASALHASIYKRPSK
jgi:hypothetical protein